MALYTTPVFTLTENSTIDETLHLLYKKNVKQVIVTEQSKPIGVISERDIGKFLENDKTSRSLDQIAVKELMQRNLITISADTQDMIEQCAIRIDIFKISSMVLINGNGSLEGIVTKSDIVRQFAIKYPNFYLVKDYMSNKVFTCRKSDSICFGLDMLNKNKISRLVVTNNRGNPVGIVTYATYLRNSNYFKKPTREYLLPDAQEKIKTLGDMISSELIIASPQDDLAKAANLMIEYHIGGIPVADENEELTGIITAADIVKAYTQVAIHKRLIKVDPHFM